MKLWHLLSPKAPHELAAIADGCERAVEVFRPKAPGEACGKARLGGGPPPLAQVAAAYRAQGLHPDDRTMARLQACDASITLEDPADPATSRLQASALRFLLDQIPGGLVLLDDFPFLSPEEAERKLLKGTRSLPGFAQVAATTLAFDDEDEDLDLDDESGAGGDEDDERISAFLDRVEQAQEDPEVAIELRAAVAHLGRLGQRIAEALVRGQARPPASLVTLLGASPRDVDEALEEIALALEDEEDD